MIFTQAHHSMELVNVIAAEKQRRKPNRRLRKSRTLLTSDQLERSLQVSKSPYGISDLQLYNFEVRVLAKELDIKEEDSEIWRSIVYKIKKAAEESIDEEETEGYDDDDPLPLDREAGDFEADILDIKMISLDNGNPAIRVTLKKLDTNEMVSETISLGKGSKLCES